jgi:hypothetical protein
MKIDIQQQQLAPLPPSSSQLLTAEMGTFERLTNERFAQWRGAG